MRRTKPTPKTDVIGRVKPTPHKDVGEYYLSKQCNSQFVKPPNWDSPGESIELLYRQNKNELNVMLKDQAELLEHLERDAQLNTDRTDAIYKMHKGLRNRFTEVNRFIKDCDDKRYKAQELINGEIETHNRLEDSISFLKTETMQMNSFRKEFLNTIATYEPYERLTNEVVQKSDIFESAQDCITRCDALMLAQEDIKMLTNKKIKQIDDMRLQMISITQMAKLKLVGVQNDLLSVSRSYEEAQSNCKKYEKLLSDSKKIISMRNLDRQESCSALHVISTILRKRKNIPERFTTSSVQEMSDFIVREVQFLKQLAEKMESDMHSKKKERVQSLCQ